MTVVHFNKDADVFSLQNTDTKREVEQAEESQRPVSVMVPFSMSQMITEKQTVAVSSRNVRDLNVMKWLGQVSCIQIYNLCHDMHECNMMAEGNSSSELCNQYPCCQRGCVGAVRTSEPRK